MKCIYVTLTFSPPLARPGFFHRHTPANTCVMFRTRVYPHARARAHTHTRARTHAPTHAGTHARTHTHTHTLHSHHQNDFCIKMGSDESHFNVSVGSDGQRRKTVSTNHKHFEDKGEPKRYRTEVLPLTSLTNALPLGQTRR